MRFLISLNRISCCCFFSFFLYLFEGQKDKRGRPRPPTSRAGETSSMRAVQTCRRRYSSFNKLMDEDDRIVFLIFNQHQMYRVFLCCPPKERKTTLFFVFFGVRPSVRVNPVKCETQMLQKTNCWIETDPVETITKRIFWLVDLIYTYVVVRLQPPGILMPTNNKTTAHRANETKKKKKKSESETGWQVDAPAHSLLIFCLPSL